MDAVKGRILLVDDDPDGLHLVARLLRLDGYEITCADSIEAALRRSEQQPLDLLVADIQLPDGSGNQLMRRLAERCHLPGIALTGMRIDTENDPALRNGFVEYLVKPVKLEKLKSAIQRVISSTRPRLHDSHADVEPQFGTYG